MVCLRKAKIFAGGMQSSNVTLEILPSLALIANPKRSSTMTRKLADIRPRRQHGLSRDPVDRE